MGHQFAPWRTGKDQTAWLSSLIEAMERISRPEWRALPIDRRKLAAMRARLARPIVSSIRGFRPGQPK
jgi:hypothetical protein